MPQLWDWELEMGTSPWKGPSPFLGLWYQKEWSHIDIWALNDVLLVLWEIPEIGGQMAVRTNVSGKSGGKKSSLDTIRSVLLTRGQLSLLGLDTLG